MQIRRFHPKNGKKLSRAGKTANKIPGVELRETSSGDIQIKATSARILANGVDLSHGQTTSLVTPFKVKNGTKVYEVNAN